jgi:hypothetical protein
MLKSKDGGVTWHRLDTIGDMHVDQHALWINPKDKKHIMMGNDGGLSRKALTHQEIVA